MPVSRAVRPEDAIMCIHRPLSGVLMVCSIAACFPIQSVLVIPALGAEPSAPHGEQIADIIGNMKAAYARAVDYQTETEVRVFREGREVETERFLYTFKKPDHIRIDMESPHSGTVLIYPDENGKVFVKPGGIAGFLKLHLSPGSTLLKASEGQRIDQTDLGLLIQNISRSLTDLRRGEIKLSRQEGRVILDVLSEDHFIPGVLTRYQFSIGETHWLPIEVREFTADGVLRRTVTFRNLTTSIRIPDSFYRIEREKPANDQPGR